MAKSSLKREKWTLSFDPTLKDVSRQNSSHDYHLTSTPRDKMILGRIQKSLASDT